MKISLYHPSGCHGNLQIYSSVIMEPHNSVFANQNLTHANIKL